MIHLLRLLSSKARRRPRLTRTPESIATPLGHVPMHRDVNPHASLDEGVERARNRCYAERGKHDGR